MAIESPLFQSAMELIGHSITHYNGKKEPDRKLLILHLANAVELILKDLVLDAGDSIYKNPKETITIQGCLSSLEKHNVELPLLNKIELLVDERNALQHRFGSPNELTSIFYMNIAQTFFKEVLKLHYDQEYDEIIKQFTDESDLIAFRMNEPTNDQELDKLKDLAKLHPLGALLAAWTYFEKELDLFIEEVGLDYRRRRVSTIELTRGTYESMGLVIPAELIDDLIEIRRIRNMAAHGRMEPTLKQVKDTVTTIEKLEAHLATLDKDVIKTNALIAKEKYECEKSGQTTLLELFSSAETGA
ncbi:TPA: hypothetical protein ACP5XP_004226 [Vibrio parahaemolyticus]|uniref:hypothetical protein n=2 Tax=Vibrio parahaemolyticus TaxID=670 RepID=UPI00111E93B5|nr:hypothetical protein [Vibrio parahaemolyticus]TOM28564.1 hypothetical protein CGH80_23860 [Vibrio parahaemolyticus]TOM39030.1 hypothetical protein CGH77_21170 [Vibrio parahaemolyticus]